MLLDCRHSRTSDSLRIDFLTLQANNSPFDLSSFLNTDAIRARHIIDNFNIKQSFF